MRRSAQATIGANRGGLGVLPAPCGHPVCRRAVVGDAAALGLVGAAAPSADPLRRRRRGVGFPPGSYPARGGAVAVRDGARGGVETPAPPVGAPTGAAGGLGASTAARSRLRPPASSAHDAPPSPAYVRNAWLKRHNTVTIYIIWWASDYNSKHVRLRRYELATILLHTMTDKAHITCRVCKRRVMRRRGALYCGRASCRGIAHRTRLQHERDKALGALDRREHKEMSNVRQRTEDTGPLRASYQREKAAIKAAGGLADLRHIRRMYAAERAPLLEEELSRPVRPSVGRKVLRQLADEELRRKAARADRNRQRKQKLRKSPLQGGSVEGQRRQTGPGIVVTRGHGLRRNR